MNPKPNRRKSEVTLIVGIICQDGIVLASDSQTTFNGAKRTDAEKIFAIDFADRPVLAACSGNSGNSARAIEIMREFATGKPIDDYRVPADIAREAMIKVKRELRQQYLDCSVEQLQDIIWKEELQSEMMLAYHHKGVPYLYKVDLSVGRSDRENSHYSALGCGANLGSYLLSEYTSPGMNLTVASFIAHHVVNTVCKHDAYCSLPIRSGIITDDVSKSPNPRGIENKSVHPTSIGLGLVVISKGKGDIERLRKLEKIMTLEKAATKKRLEKLWSNVHDDVNKHLAIALASPKNPPKKTMSFFTKTFLDVSVLKHFKSKQ